MSPGSTNWRICRSSSEVDIHLRKLTQWLICVGEILLSIQAQTKRPLWSVKQRCFVYISLCWHHMMRVEVTHFTGQSTVCSKTSLGYQQSNYQSVVLLAFVLVIHNNQWMSMMSWRLDVFYSCILWLLDITSNFNRDVLVRHKLSHTNAGCLSPTGGGHLSSIREIVLYGSFWFCKIVIQI